MIEQYKTDLLDLRCMDCMEMMRTMPDNSVDSIVTDPPYGLSKEPDVAEVMRHWLTGEDYIHKGSGFMGKTWDSFVPGPTIWREAYRVLKPGGHLLAFAGTRTQDLMGMAIRLAGFENRDCLMYIFGSGFPKSHNLKGDWQGFGTALKPAYEPCLMFRKPLAKGNTVAANVLQHGTGAINVDGCRVGNTVETWPKSRSYMAKGGYDFDPGENGETVTQQTSDAPAGRWPANLIHSGEPEVLGLFPVTGASKSTPRNNGEFKSVAKGRDLPHVTHGHDDTGGSAARFFYCAKASKRDRDEGVNTDAKIAGVGDARPSGDFGERLGPRQDGSIRKPVFGRNTHPTVKPTDLMRYLCRLVTPPGGLVLDPFMGSGSTGKAAMLEGFRFIGSDLSPEYFEIAKARIENALTTKTEEDNKQDPQMELSL